MRALFVICLLFLIPPAYVLYGDYTASTSEFHMSSVADVWMSYDRAGFEKFKSGYVSHPDEWERDVRPYLEWKALPLSFLPALFFYLSLFVLFVTGRGPFRDIDFAPRQKQDTDVFARSSALKQRNRQQFTRK